MTTSSPLSVIALAAFVAIGAAIGLADLHGLRSETRALVSGGVSMRSLAMHAGRLVATVGALFLIACSGASHLLAASVGFLAIRFVTVAQARRSA